MYIRKTTTVSDDMELIQCHGPGRYGAPGQKRRKREKKTPERVKEQNRRNRAEKLQLMILSNFYEHGHHVVLAYPKGQAPESYEDAERILIKFLARIQRRMKGQFRYIAATERGKRTAVLHHHMIIQDAPDLMELIESEWPGKRVHSTPTYEDDTCGRQLADYIVKSIDKDSEGTYHISRNLRKPEVKRELITGRMGEPTAPAGYQIVPDTLYIGVNRFTGWQYQRYIIRANVKGTGRLSEWKRDLAETETPKTVTEAAKETFNKVAKAAIQNGKGLFGVFGKLKSRLGAGKKYIETDRKPAGQNGKAGSRGTDYGDELTHNHKHTGKR